MIVVGVELWKGGDPNQVEDRGTAHISNVGGSERVVESSAIGAA